MALYPINEFIKILENQKCHITRNKLRHYEREGLIKSIREKRGERDRWFYTEQDIGAVIAITNLISLSWKAKEVSALLKLGQEMKAILKKMKETKEMFLAMFKGEIERGKDPNISKEVEFWKNFSESDHTEFDIIPKMIEHYSNKKFNEHEILRNSLNMLEKMRTGVEVVNGYNEEINSAEKEMKEMNNEIYGIIINLGKK